MKKAHQFDGLFKVHLNAFSLAGSFAREYGSKDMKYLTKYWPILAIIAAFLAGIFSAPDNSKEIEAMRKKERTMFQQQIVKKQVEIQGLIEAQREIERQRYADSLFYAGALERNQTAYNRLKKKYNEINLSRADAHQLDSIITALYP